MATCGSFWMEQILHRNLRQAQLWELPKNRFQAQKTDGCYFNTRWWFADCGFQELHQQPVQRTIQGIEIENPLQPGYDGSIFYLKRELQFNENGIDVPRAQGTFPNWVNGSKCMTDMVVRLHIMDVCKCLILKQLQKISASMQRMPNFSGLPSGFASMWARIVMTYNIQCELWEPASPNPPRLQCELSRNWQAVWNFKSAALKSNAFHQEFTTFFGQNFGAEVGWIFLRGNAVDVEPLFSHSFLGP